MTSTKNPRLTMRPCEDFEKECLITMEEFLGSVNCGGFIDYDGYGELATETLVSDIAISPSTAKNPNWKPPEWATHVAWYNK